MNMDKYAPYNFRTQQFESLKQVEGFTFDKNEALFFWSKAEAENRALQLNSQVIGVNWVAMKLSDKTRNTFKKLQGERK